MLTIDARVELFKKQFPQEKIKFVQERQGTDFDVLEINHTWMCKSAKTQEGISALDQEVKVLKALQGKILTQIPEPLYYEENFLVYKKIAGSPLISYAFFRYGNKQRSKLICDLVDFLMQLHKALDQEQVESLAVMKSSLPWSLATLQEHSHYLQDTPELLEVFNNIMKMYEKSSVQPAQLALIHNNFSMNNIIVDPITGQLRGILDFTNVAYDDKTLDLCIHRKNPVEFSKAITFVYALMTNTSENPEKIYSYYFATEFSRYFGYRKQDNAQMAQKTLHGIVESLRKFLATHDNCADQNCGHHKDQVQEKVAELTA
jgi:aminoglycoside phosphotransferase (APT) family kinase protein